MSPLAIRCSRLMLVHWVSSLRQYNLDNEFNMAKRGVAWWPLSISDPQKSPLRPLALCRVRRYNRPYGMIIVRGRWK